jgi:hypothetical protein
MSEVNFNELVKNPIKQMSMQFESRYLDILHKTFTDDEEKWFICI